MSHKINDLLTIMRKLRDPKTGCPWDIEQTFETIAPYTIEEAYEVEEAIQTKDMDSLKDELGDLLFQVIFHSQIATEQESFTFEDVVENVCEKMIRRHPHVFGDASIEDADAQTSAWEAQKAKERSLKANESGEKPSALDGLTRGLPALMRAIKLQKRVARVGFDWPETEQVLDKIQEEMTELVDEIKKPDAHVKIFDEFGDLLFVYVNLGRHLKVDSEESLRAANAKFERRFRRVETLIEEAGKTMETSSLEEMDAVWDAVKMEEKSA